MCKKISEIAFVLLFKIIIFNRSPNCVLQWLRDSTGDPKQFRSVPVSACYIQEPFQKRKSHPRYVRHVRREHETHTYVYNKSYLPAKHSVLSSNYFRFFLFLVKLSNDCSFDSFTRNKKNYFKWQFSKMEAGAAEIHSGQLEIQKEDIKIYFTNFWISRKPQRKQEGFPGGLKPNYCSNMLYLSSVQQPTFVQSAQTLTRSARRTSLGSVLSKSIFFLTTLIRGP